MKCLLLALLLLSHPISASVLRDYVRHPDDAFRWCEHESVKGDGYTLYALELWSQRWRSEAEVDRTVWHHWLMVVVPDEVVSNKGMLRIASGSNGESAPMEIGHGLAGIAKATGSIVAEVRMIPNQNLRFADESDPRYIEKGRKEDELVAYTWDKYLKTGEAEWLARLPMTKAVVRAMDAVQAFAKEKESPLDQFVLVGASKRGWTAWTAAAVDERVCAVIPMVIDMLNMKPSMEHHFRTYGQWAFALRDYIEMGIHKKWTDPRLDEILAMVEPYAMRDQLEMPKYVINAAGDEFFLPDSSQFYYGELPGQKYLRYVPNSGHRLSGGGVDLSVAAFYTCVLAGETLPQYGWSYGEGKVEVTTDRKPLRATLWHAHNPEARDFRLCTIGEVWQATPIEIGEGITAELPVNEEGWTASFVELQYETRQGLPLTFTTEVFVTPETLPYAFEIKE